LNKSSAVNVLSFRYLGCVLGLGGEEVVLLAFFTLLGVSRFYSICIWLVLYLQFRTKIPQHFYRGGKAHRKFISHMLTELTDMRWDCNAYGKTLKILHTLFQDIT